MEASSVNRPVFRKLVARFRQHLQDRCIMKPVTILAQAVGAWLQYEFACNRSNLFSERYLSVAIADALNAIHRDEVRSEYLHPVLAPHKTGPGRRPEVDFATIRHYPAVTSVVESKWVGSGGILAADVLWDLLRLELIANASNVPAYFVLAGRRKYLEKFFASKAFSGNPTAQGKYRHLLKLDHRPTGIRIDSPNDDRREMFRKLFHDYQTVSFPSRISTSTPALYPEACPMFQYQAYVWRVLSPTVSRFMPRNNRAYAR